MIIMYKIRYSPEFGEFRTRLEYAACFVLNDCRDVSNEGFLRDRFIGALCFLLSPLEIRGVYRARSST